MAHSGAEILFFLSFESFSIFREYAISSIFISVGRLISEHPASLTRRLIVQRGEGWFMIHTETSGRGAFHYLLGPVIPSLLICHGVFAQCDFWAQFNPVCTKCKQKLLFLFVLYSHISKHNHINVIAT